MEYKLRDGTPVEIVGDGPLSKRFKQIRRKGEIQTFLVFAETMRYRFDDAEHPFDVIEVDDGE